MLMNLLYMLSDALTNYIEMSCVFVMHIRDQTLLKQESVKGD